MFSVWSCRVYVLPSVKVRLVILYAGLLLRLRNKDVGCWMWASRVFTVTEETLEGWKSWKVKYIWWCHLFWRNTPEMCQLSNTSSFCIFITVTGNKGLSQINTFIWMFIIIICICLTRFHIFLKVKFLQSRKMRSLMLWHLL